MGELLQLAVRTEVPPDTTLDGLAVSIQTGIVDETPLPLTISACGLPVALLVTAMELSVDTADVGV